MSLYDIAGYGAMVGDEARFQAYRDAMREKIGAHTTVLDIGTGTGLHALVACQLGARHVYAIEPSETIQVARQIARDNGFGQRITFIQDVSTRAQLPERVDVVVSDLRGVLPLFARHVPSIIDARERLLRDGGALIPQRDELRAAPVEAEEVYRQIVGVWGPHTDGLDMSAARAMTTHHVHRKRVSAADLLASPVRWATLDYATVSEPNARGVIECAIQRDGTMRGISCWFDGELTERVRFSNAPGEGELVYGMAFFPLPEPVPVVEGDGVRIEICAHLVGGEYTWRWRTTVTRVGDDVAVASFDQSSFQGTPLSPRSLERAASSYVPTLSSDGEVDRDALQMIDGGTPLGQIAERLAARYPGTFATAGEALDRVAELSRRYAE